MTERKTVRPRRRELLTREQIIQAAIELLDRDGESGLTFRTLSEKLATGPGSIYWHIASKNELLTAACDAIVAQAVSSPLPKAAPEKAIRKLALAIFDAMAAHPWIGSAFALSPDQMPVLRIVERIGQQVNALGVPVADQWSAAAALMSYILGVGGQNAAHVQLSRTHGIKRADFLNGVSKAWSQLDPGEYPFASSIAGPLLIHDDRADFLEGINLILAGIHALQSGAAQSPARE